jgi:hypothetical protein
VTRIALIACSATKRDTARAARYLYTGDLFRKSLAYAVTHCDGFAILSAKHGLLQPDTVVEPYDARLSRRKAVRLAWARGVVAQLKAAYDVSQTTFVLLAGRDYREGLEASDLNTVNPFPAVRGLGDMKKWLADAVRPQYGEPGA